jgi:hypothetical protein
MLVITGPGRSGTSMLGQFCCRLGFNPGGEWCDAIDAGMEHPRVAAINAALYREARRTGGVSEALAKYRYEMSSLDLAVVKDPRFTFHPAILRAWISVRPDITVLLTYRNPEQSIASRKRHKKFLFIKHKVKPESLKCDMADALEVMLECGVPFEILLFPTFLNQYEKVYAALTGLGLTFDRETGCAHWDSLVDESRVHFRCTPPESPSVEAGPAGFRNPFKRLSASQHPS